MRQHYTTGDAIVYIARRIFWLTVILVGSVVVTFTIHIYMQQEKSNEKAHVEQDTGN